jgi:sec-independent protein translocase protein TatA
MGNVGALEIVLILLVALIVFGPKRLPEMGRSLGRGIREFRESVANIAPTEADFAETQTVKAAPASVEPLAASVSAAPHTETARSDTPPAAEQQSKERTG